MTTPNRVGEPADIRQAAADAVAQHLAQFSTSMAIEDLWENHPDLTEQQAIDASALALQLASTVQEAMAQVGPLVVDPTMYNHPCRDCNQLFNAHPNPRCDAWR